MTDEKNVLSTHADALMSCHALFHRRTKDERKRRIKFDDDEFKVLLRV